jgi:hypothetical protein
MSAAPVSSRTARQARARLKTSITKHLITDFDEHGAEVIARMRKDKPVDYLKMVTAILEAEDASEAAASPNYNVIERRIVRPGIVDGGGL